MKTFRLTLILLLSLFVIICVHCPKSTPESRLKDIISSSIDSTYAISSPIRTIRVIDSVSINDDIRWEIEALRDSILYEQKSIKYWEYFYKRCYADNKAFKHSFLNDEEYIAAKTKIKMFEETIDWLSSNIKSSNDTTVYVKYSVFLEDNDAPTFYFSIFKDGTVFASDTTELGLDVHTYIPNYTENKKF